MELETTTKAPVERLRLDRANPRLEGEAAEASDERIIARLYRAAELDELLQSISANGYLDIEPLVVIRNGDDDGLIVLEGNRRLATLRLLREPALVSRIAAAERTRIAVPEIDDEVRQTLNEVSVYLVASRERARAFIGFKHINGPQKWDAYAKARFAADWYRKGRADGIGLEQIEQAIGDRHDTIRRMVSGHLRAGAGATGRGCSTLRTGIRRSSVSRICTPRFRVQAVHGLPGSRSRVVAARSDAGAGAAGQAPPAEAGARLDIRLEGRRRGAGRAEAEPSTSSISVRCSPMREGRHVLEQTGNLDARRTRARSPWTRGSRRRCCARGRPSTTRPGSLRA